MADGGQETTGSMDQVRDLLFGAQVRQIDERIARQEAAVTARLEALQRELKESIKALENSINSRFTSELSRQNETNNSIENKISSTRSELDNRAKAIR